MKLANLCLAVLLLAGCGHVNAQDDKTWTTMGTTTAHTINCPEGEHYEGPTIWRMVCVKGDGKPPRIVQYYDPPLDAKQKEIYIEHGSTGCILPAPENSICIYGQPHKIIFRWECDKGYEPDGLEVTWPNGVFTPKPARCKAVEKQ